MLKVVSSCWALFLGLGLIMLGNGLQGSLLGLHASFKGFSISTTGIVMSGYFMGMVIGAVVVPKIVQHVGHVRCFGALASLASTSILVHLTIVEPLVWWVLRIITGFAYAGLYVVTESWLNNIAKNETRGQLLSFYMLVSLGGLAGGQFMLNIASPEGSQLFILISVLVSIAVIPILISVSPAPAFEATEFVSIRQLIQVSPLGVFGTFSSGIASGAVFGIGAVYASIIGLGTEEISFFMGSLIIGGVVMQYPIGWLSDVFGRRRMIILTCFIGGVLSFSASMVVAEGLMIYVQVALIGGLSLPLYSLCTAHTNDYLNPSQMVAASGTLVMANGLGATMGAPVAAYAMELTGPHALFMTIGISFTIVCIFAIIRTTQRSSVSVEDQGDFVPLAPTPTSAGFNPDLELEEIEAALDVGKEEIHESFGELVEELKLDDEGG